MHPADPDGDRTRLNPLRAAARQAGDSAVAPTDAFSSTADTSSAIPDTAAPSGPEPDSPAPGSPAPAGTDRLSAAPDTDESAPAADSDGTDEGSHREWTWVEQWHSDGERPAWAPGITLGVFIAGLVAVAIIVLTNGLSDTPWLALLINLVIAAGMAPALWLSRELPVFRFLAGGAAVGLLLGWAWVLLTPDPADMAQPAPVVAVVAGSAAMPNGLPAHQ